MEKLKIIMPKLTLIATSSFGIESVVADELKSLGYSDLTVENGKVKFIGDESDIVKCNIWLRCADRLFLEMGEFRATDFEELYQGTLQIPWEKFIPQNGKMHIVGKSIKSKLFSVPDCQSIVKKAVVEAMKRKYKDSWFPEDGPVYKIEVALLKDKVTLSIDTSGNGLHKRGYRLAKGEAPLRETLAAAMILLSKWQPDRIFMDPFCGSGTIPIEAALIGKNIAPGLKREFVSESWPNIPQKLWKKERERASEVINDTVPVIFASDHDKNVFQKAKENAERADVSEYITFQKKPLEELSSKKKYGCIVCNPPYGERMSEKNEVEKLYREMGKIFAKFESWSLFVLSPHEDFQKLFGTSASKNRKLYNGKIKTYLYQYFGPLPPRK